MGNDVMSRALQQISRSPFFEDIKTSDMQQRFVRAIFFIYDGKFDPAEYVSQYNQSMAIYSKNEVLMCKFFLSSLGPTTMRWFDRLEKRFIDGYDELT